MQNQNPVDYDDDVLIAQFVNLLPGTTANVARYYLEVADGDLQTACELFLSNSDRPRAELHSARPATPVHPPSSPDSDEGIPELIIPQPPRRMSDSEKQALKNQRDLKDEQDKAYKKSIERDTARAEENLRQLKEAEEDLLKKERWATRRELIHQEIKADRIPRDCSEDSVIIHVRFPNGQHARRTFSAEDSLEHLFNYVLVHDACPMDFSLTTNYPRVLLKCFPEWYKEFSQCLKNYESNGEIKTFRQAGLEKSAAVYVIDNDA